MTQDRVEIDVSAIQCLESWARSLALREHQIAVLLCCDTWAKGMPSATVGLQNLASRAATSSKVVARVLRSLARKGVLSTLVFRNDNHALVALTPRWRMEETP